MKIDKFLPMIQISMARFYKSGNSKSYRHKKGGYRGKPKKSQEKYKDTKGFWEYSDFQKIYKILSDF